MCFYSQAGIKFLFRLQKLAANLHISWYSYTYSMHELFLLLQTKLFFHCLFTVSLNAAHRQVRWPRPSFSPVHTCWEQAVISLTGTQTQEERKLQTGRAHLPNTHLMLVCYFWLNSDWNLIVCESSVFKWKLVWPGVFWINEASC